MKRENLESRSGFIREQKLSETLGDLVRLRRIHDRRDDRTRKNQRGKKSYDYARVKALAVIFSVTRGADVVWMFQYLIHRNKTSKPQR